MDIDRRRFLQLLSFTIGGKLIWLTPGQALSQGAQHKLLTQTEVLHLEKIAEAFVPGSREAGVSYFIDHHLSVNAEDSLLMIRYLGVAPPFLDFYRASIAAAEKYAHNTFQKDIDDLEEQEFTSFIDSIATGDVDAWEGPPATFFYFVLRSDAIDVVYGTEEGFENINFPYMAHIQPPDKW